MSSGQDAITTLEYDTQGNLHYRIENGYDDAGSISRTTTYTYDSFGRIESIDGLRTNVNDITTFVYYDNTLEEGNNRARLYMITDALGHSTTYSDYNVFGKPELITTPQGITITATYDAMGRVLTQTQGGLATTYTYYANGQLHEASLPDDRTVAYTYTPSGEIEKITDNLGNSITYTYDDLNQKTSEDVKDPQGVLQRYLRYSYEQTGVLDKTTQFDDTSEDLNYDAVRNLVERINAKSDPTTYEYDALNRPTAMIQPGSIATGYAYDSNDNLKSVTDPRGNITSYTYDDFGRKTSQNSPETGLTHYGYDEADNLTSVTDAKGQTALYAYDALNRLTNASYADGAEETSVYDSCPNGIGKLCAVHDASGSTSWRYDSLGRVAGKTQVVKALNTTYSLNTGYVYNDAGQLHGIAYPSGMCH